MIIRNAEKTIISLLYGFPIVTITGPRQSGKTTLAKAIFADKPYVSLEAPDTRLFAREDPRSFLNLLRSCAHSIIILLRRDVDTPYAILYANKQEVIEHANP